MKKVTTRPDDLTPEDVENIVVSVASEIIWPSIRRHEHPTDLLTEWIFSFPEEHRPYVTRAALATSVRLNAEFMANLLEEAGVMAGTTATTRTRSYMERLKQRLQMNRHARH